MQTASVLGVVTDEAREILAARNKYENDNSNLLGENKLQRDKMKALEEAKGWAEERLNIRNDEASVNRARIQSLVWRWSHAIPVVLSLTMPDARAGWGWYVRH